MTTDPIILQAQTLNDRYAALLRDSLRVLSPETVSKWITDMEATLHSPDTEPADRLECNAMLVGVVRTMLDGIEGAGP